LGTLGRNWGRALFSIFLLKQEENDRTISHTKSMASLFSCFMDFTLEGSGALASKQE